MSKIFDEMVRSLDEDDLSVIKGYILNTVREAYPDPREEKDESEDIVQIMATGTLEALRTLARVLASEEA